MFGFFQQCPHTGIPAAHFHPDALQVVGLVLKGGQHGVQPNNQCLLRHGIMSFLSGVA
jgi:hypothetical protein